MMRKLLLLAISAPLLIYLLAPQWRSFDVLGEERFRALNHGPSELVVGVCWPFTANQDGMAQGLELARDEINSRGLAAGMPVRLILREPFSLDQSKRIAIEFASNSQMSAVIGYYDDSDALKSSMLYEAARLLHIIVGANNTTMTTRGLKYIVRTILPSDKLARSLARMTVARGRRRLALLWEEDAYGEDLAYQFRVALDQLNVQVVYQWSYTRENADFRKPVNELKGIDEDMIFFAGLEPLAGDFLRTARKVGVKSEIVGAFSDTPSMREHAGPGLEGAMYFEFYNVHAPTPENQSFVRKFRARYGHNPDTWAAQGYDALHLLARAVQSTGSRNPLDLVYAIRFTDPWNGANGTYRFDPRGELEDKPLYLNIFRNGVPKTLGNIDAPETHR